MNSKSVEIRVSPEEKDNTPFHKSLIASQLNISTEDIHTIKPTRRSIDARGREPKYQLRYTVFFDAPKNPAQTFEIQLQNVSKKESVVIIGLGPAGLFSALRLIELGYRPIIIERGKTVRERRFDIAGITKRGVVPEDSNYCFGEGGAGTFSDGKLYTRSTKRGSLERILHIFVHFGASESILIDAHPHIGTNKLPQIIEKMRAEIISAGGEIHFNSRLTDIAKIGDGRIRVKTENGLTIDTSSCILATGHSASDIYKILEKQNLTLENKPFALGVRVEHPQELIDSMQYNCKTRSPYLPAASYSLVTQARDRGVFSFCMCPGGIICPAATNDSEVVVNGWSPSKRNSRFANSGVVVEVTEEDISPFRELGPLAGLAFRSSIEQASFEAGGGKQVAPAQRLCDFVSQKDSSTLPDCSYLPGIRSANLHAILPQSISSRLVAGLLQFDEKMKGYLTNEAVVLAVESRTSSPVKIPREKVSLMHPEMPGLFPCGEGAGYAGGIVSAAMDGERIAEAVSTYLSVK